MANFHSSESVIFENLLLLGQSPLEVTSTDWTPSGKTHVSTEALTAALKSPNSTVTSIIDGTHYNANYGNSSLEQP